VFQAFCQAGVKGAVRVHRMNDKQNSPWRGLTDDKWFIFSVDNSEHVPIEHIALDYCTNSRLQIT